jgi:hypothetical protein
MYQKELIMENNETWVSKSNRNMIFTVDKIIFDGLVPNLEKISEEQYHEEVGKGNFKEKGNVIFGNLALGKMACGYVHYSEAYLQDKFIKG